jgi:hypothetical protein
MRKRNLSSHLKLSTFESLELNGIVSMHEQGMKILSIGV